MVAQLQMATVQADALPVVARMSLIVLEMNKLQMTIDST